MPESPVDRELCETVLAFIKLLKRYQVKALSLDSVLSAILALPPQDRAQLTRADLQRLIDARAPELSRQADELTAGLERALAEVRDFQMLLWLYTQHEAHRQ